MKFLFFVLLTLFVTRVFAINIRIQSIETKEVKTYSTEETFKIPVETSTQKCFLTKDAKNLWGYSCTSRIKTKEWIPSHKTIIDCLGSNSSLYTLLMDISADGGGNSAASKFNVIISCSEIKMTN